MKVSLIVVGVNEWEKHTEPFLDSLREHESDVECVVVDNGSHPVYELEKYDVIHARLGTTVCYAAALNYGALMAGESDWYMFLNNDVLIHQPFVHQFARLDKGIYYGFAEHLFNRSIPYLSGWNMVVSGDTWKKIGKFDEALKPMYFEDADYSIRCRNNGVKTKVEDRKEWGISHRESERKQERVSYMTKYAVARQKNRTYVMRKHGLT